MPEALLSPTYFLLGPTAVGKSDIAVELGKLLGGEIVGADAFQIYRGLETLTAAPTLELRRAVPHHLIGEVDPAHAFDVAQYERLARRRIAEIQSRGKTAIVCGGTGLYVRALTHGLNDLPAADPAIRAELDPLPVSELYRRFQALDPKGAEQIDRLNPRRLIRALEVCLQTGQPFSTFRDRWEAMPAGLRGAVVLRDRAELNARIDARVEMMFKQGVVEEVATCTSAGPTASQAIGFREIRSFILGETTRAECIGAIQQATRRYAKRQLTWFRRETGFARIQAGSGASPAEIAAHLARLGGSPAHHLAADSPI
jgi:tRNA dimethylallyltransferase